MVGDPQLRNNIRIFVEIANHFIDELREEEHKSDGLHTRIIYETQELINELKQYLI